MLEYDSLLKQAENIENCYFIYSYDLKLVLNFLDKVRLHNVIEEFKDFNYSSFKYEVNFDFENLFEICNTIPMMQEKRIVVLENCLFLKLDGDKKEQIEKLKELISNLPKECVLICYYIYQEQDKNKDVLSSFQKLGQICKINELRGEDFYKEVKNILKKHKVEIDNSLFVYFCNRVSNDFFHIENEVLKLKMFLNGRKVSKDDIDEVVSRSFEHNVFLFVNAVLDKNLKSSLKNFKELMQNGKEFDYIFSMINNQFIKFLDVSIFIKSGLTSKDIIKRTKINQYVLNNFLRFSKKYSIREIFGIIVGFTDMYCKSRSDSGFDILYEFERYIVNICLKKWKSNTIRNGIRFFMLELYLISTLILISFLQLYFYV